MKYRIVYDATRMQPGCVILQAAMGGTVPNFVELFPDGWLIHPTDDMVLFEVDDEQLAKLAEIARLTKKAGAK